MRHLTVSTFGYIAPRTRGRTRSSQPWCSSTAGDGCLAREVHTTANQLRRDFFSPRISLLCNRNKSRTSVRSPLLKAHRRSLIRLSVMSLIVVLKKTTSDIVAKKKNDDGKCDFMFWIHIGCICVLVLNFSDSHDPLMRRFVRKKRMVVVSVEYVHNLACYRTVSLKVLLRLIK